MEHDLKKIQLPLVNSELQESKHMRQKLELALLETIQRFEIENNYKFELYEIDQVFLSRISSTHDRYIFARFKKE